MLKPHRNFGAKHMNQRNRLTLAAAVLAVAAGLSAPAGAQEATPWPELMKMADANGDGMVTKKEYLAMMAKMWDQKHAKMMKADAKMKVGMMDMEQFKSYMRGTFVDPGKVGGN
jgi:hypothetical protein